MFAENTYRICRRAFPSQNPDWKEPYTYVCDMPDDFIAFEFLRPKRLYWAAWASLLDLPTCAEERSKLSGWQHELSVLDRRGWRARVFETFGVWKFSDPRLQLQNGMMPWCRFSSLSGHYAYAVGLADAHGSLDYTFDKAPPTTITIVPDPYRQR